MSKVLYFLFVVFSVVSAFGLFSIVVNSVKWFSVETLDLFLLVVFFGGVVWCFLVGFIWLRGFE